MIFASIFKSYSWKIKFYISWFCKLHIICLIYFLVCIHVFYFYTITILHLPCPWEILLQVIYNTPTYRFFLFIKLISMERSCYVTYFNAIIILINRLLFYYTYSLYLGILIFGSIKVKKIDLNEYCKLLSNNDTKTIFPKSRCYPFLFNNF